MKPELFEAIKKAYIEELTSSDKTSTPCGLLGIGLDQHADIICEHIKVDMPGYANFAALLESDEQITEKIETELIIPFEEQAYNAMDRAELEFVTWLTTTISEMKQ